MFVRYFIELAAPYPDVDRELTRDPGSWLPGLAGDARAEGERRMAEVGFGRGVRIEREVAVEVGLPAGIGAKRLLPIRWHPTGAALLPALDGELEVAPVGAHRTQLSMTASYTPPFGLLGRVADRALMHRVAEATVKDFVDRVAEGLKSRLGTGATT
jgi:hypothetical protein